MNEVEQRQRARPAWSRRVMALIVALMSALPGCVAQPCPLETVSVGRGHGVVIGRRLVLAPSHLIAPGGVFVGVQLGRVVLTLAATPEDWVMLEVDDPLGIEPVVVGAPGPGDSGAPVVSAGRLLGLVTGRRGGAVVVSSLDVR